MTGFGSPCGACKFLRRKCVRGCVFAPYFCHEEGATHFAAIHKVFGASNVSKLLTHLPVADRCEAAVTISYEAQARVQDPIYGCVSHIFVLQQQVVNLQAQLASLKAQATQGASSCSSTSSSQENNFHGNYPTYSQDVHSLFPPEYMRMQEQFHLNQNNNAQSTPYYDYGFIDPNNPMVCIQNTSLPEENVSFNSFEDSSHAMHTNTQKWTYQDAEDLQSVTFAYLQHS